MTSSTKIQWRVQVRKSRAHKWVNKGLFETRSVARERASDLRAWWADGPCSGQVYGNTRVVRYVKGG